MQEFYEKGLKKKTFQFFSEIWKKSELMTTKDFFSFTGPNPLS